MKLREFRIDDPVVRAESGQVRCLDLGRVGGKVVREQFAQHVGADEQVGRTVHARLSVTEHPLEDDRLATAHRFEGRFGHSEVTTRLVALLRALRYVHLDQRAEVTLEPPNGRL